jgi:hypothetical protein
VTVGVLLIIMGVVAGSVLGGLHAPGLAVLAALLLGMPGVLMLARKSRRPPPSGS